MTSDTQTEMDRLSPDDLMTGFTRSPIVPALVIAFLLHGVLIGGSWGLGLLFAGDPDDPEQQTTDTQAETASREDDDAEPAADGGEADGESSDDADTAGEDPPLDEAGNPIPERVRQTEIYQQTHSTPEEGETPDEPDLDISIEDTNVGN